MYDDTSRGFPWFKVVLGGASILVLVGSFGGFMWLLRTYVDPPRIASGPSAAELLASVSLPSAAEPREPRIVAPPPDDKPALPPPAEPYERAGPPPNSGAPITANAPAWAGLPLPNVPPMFEVASAPPAAERASPLSAEPSAVTFDGPVPLPRPKPRTTARAPAAAPAQAPVALPSALPSAVTPPPAIPTAPRPRPPA